MNTRLILLGSLIVLAMSFAIWSGTMTGLTWRLYPYFYPQLVCLTKDGSDTGLGKKCLAGRKKIFEERSIVRGFLRDTSVYLEVDEICKKACRSKQICSQYVIKWPGEMYDRHLIPMSPGTFVCTLMRDPEKQTRANLRTNL